MCLNGVFEEQLDAEDCMLAITFFTGRFAVQPHIAAHNHNLRLAKDVCILKTQIMSCFFSFFLSAYLSLPVVFGVFYQVININLLMQPKRNAK